MYAHTSTTATTTRTTDAPSIIHEIIHLLTLENYCLKFSLRLREPISQSLCNIRRNFVYYVTTVTEIPPPLLSVIFTTGGGHSQFAILNVFTHLLHSNPYPKNVERK